MRPGTMDRRVTFQSLTTNVDSSGEEVRSWNDAFTTWAMVRERSGKEDEESQQISAMWETIIKIRYRSGVNREMRINYDGDLFDISSIKELGRREGLEIKATRIWLS